MRSAPMYRGRRMDWRGPAGVFLLLFLLLMARNCACGLEYFPQLDDYIQYHNYATAESFSALQQSTGLLASRPLAGLADYVLVEADGAAGRPMKAHAPHEPVIPAGANQVICVVGASGFGQPVSQAAHRPELYARLAGIAPDAPITPAAAAAVLGLEGLHSRVYVNQADTAGRLSAGRELQRLLPCPAAVGALQTEGSQVLCW